MSQIRHQKTGTASNRFGNVGGGDKYFVEEEIYDWLQVCFDVGGQKLRVHIKNAANGGDGKAKGEEIILEGNE